MLIIGSNHWLKWHVHMPFALIDAFCWLRGALRCCLLAAAAFSTATRSFQFLRLKYGGSSLLQLYILQQVATVTACQVFVLILDEMHLSQLPSSYPGSAWVQPELAPDLPAWGCRRSVARHQCCSCAVRKFMNNS